MSKRKGAERKPIVVGGEVRRRGVNFTPYQGTVRKILPNLWAEIDWPHFAPRGCARYMHIDELEAVD